MKTFKIADVEIGAGRTYVVAELSANHCGEFDTAVKTILAMARSGADAVKLQTYRPQSLTLDVDNEYFGPIASGLWKGRTHWDLYREAQTPWEWTKDLMAVAREEGLDCFSSPFDWDAVDFLAGLDVPAFKIASFEITDIPLIARAAKVGKPMILSTGIALEGDIRKALEACYSAGNRDVAVLKCTSAYPAPLADMNLRAILTLGEVFDVPVGLSDHTVGHSAAVAAVSLGACMVEKHFTLSRSQGGADAAFSMEPEEFAAMVRSIREVEMALGEGGLGLTDSQKASRVHRRSLFVVRDMREGDVLTLDDVSSLRPGAGLPPEKLFEILGKRVVRDVARGAPLSLDLLE